MVSFRQKAFGRRLTSLISSVLICSILLAAMPAGVAFAGECDGTAGDDDGISNPAVVCSADPATPDADVGLDFGNDTYVQDTGVTSDSVGGDALDDGTSNTGDGGADNITINGTVTGCVDGDNTDGDGGNDVITVNGTVVCSVNGDYASGSGGDDSITINGEVGGIIGDYAGDDGGDDQIRVNSGGLVGIGILGDGILGFGNGGNDTIVILGDVLGSVSGDDTTFGDGGDDAIFVYGSVAGDIYGDDAGGAGGNDSVTLGAGAIVGGLIDGEDGYDTLTFEFLAQSQLLGLDPVGGAFTYQGQTYTWANFEELIGLFEELGVSFRVVYSNGSLRAVDQLFGISVFAEHGRIAFISFDSLDMAVGGSRTYNTPNSAGWYVTVTNLGANPNNSSNDLFQVTIFDAAGGQQGRFTFSN
ncbi:MAG: hypothetical protein WD751_11215 [Anaerolineales bacterium]